MVLSFLGGCRYRDMANKRTAADQMVNTVLNELRVASSSETGVPLNSTLVIVEASRHKCQCSWFMSLSPNQHCSSEEKRSTNAERNNAHEIRRERNLGVGLLATLVVET